VNDRIGIAPNEPLTSQNAALVLVDHQVGIMTGVRDYSTGELKHNVVALAKAAKSLKLPIVVTTTAHDACRVRRSQNSFKRCRASRLSTVHRSTLSTTRAWLAPSRPLAAGS
jgi:nicotinamidase-related amidase